MQILPTISARSLQFYVIARHWAADMEFFQTEAAFFDRLLNEHFMALANSAHVSRLSNLIKKIASLNAEERHADKLLTEQIEQLELMAEDVIPEDTDQLAQKQIYLENLIGTITHEYRQVKKDLFSLVEELMRDHNAQ